MQVGAGEMSRSIDIQSPTYVEGDSGGQTETYMTTYSVWAKKEDGSKSSAGSNEDYEDGQLLATHTSFFTIWYIADLSTEMRIVFDGDNYDILSFEELGHRAQQRVRAMKRSND